MNGLNVTVEVSGLLAAVRKYNPQADLTGLKAYLLDMALAEGETEMEPPMMHAVQDRPGDPNSPSHVELVPTNHPQYVAPRRVPKEPAAPATISVPGLPDIPAGVIGAPSQRSRTQVRVNRALRPSADALSDKERKRKELEELTSLDSKELLARMHQPSGKRNEHNQLTDEGADHAPASGDLEIG